MRRLVGFFVNNYVLTFSFFGALGLFGGVSALGLGVDLLPELEIPVVAVVTRYPGAGPEEISRQTAEPIEGQLMMLPGIDSVSSHSHEGFGIVTAQFSSGTDVNEAAVGVGERVNAVAASFPAGAETPTVQKFDPTDQPLLNVALSHPGEALSAVQAFAENELQPALRRVDGVADVSVIGPTEREVQVLLEPRQLAAHGLTPQGVMGAISASAVDVSAGSLNLGDSRLLLAGRAVPGSLGAVEEIRVDSARSLRVGDVATVHDAAGDVGSYSRLNGEPVVLLEVHKLAGSNAVTTAGELRRTLRDFKPPEGYHVKIVGDTTTFVSASVHDTITEMGFAALAVSLIVLFFTGRLGSVFAVVLAIPVSVAGTLIVINLFGFTLNIVTLLAITVAIGLVVDDAIVVAEQIDRYREQGLSRRESVLRGASGVSTAVLAATLSLLAVFIPISFLPGVVGQFFKQFGVTMAAAITFSYLEAMFFLTVRLALAPDPLPPGWGQLGGASRKLAQDARWGVALLRRAWFWPPFLGAGVGLYLAKGPGAVALLAVLPALALLRYFGRLFLFLLGAASLTLFRLGTWLVDRGRAVYLGSLSFMLERTWLVLGTTVLLLGSLFYAFPRLGFNFQPPNDSGLIGVTLELPTNTSLERTNEVASSLERALLTYPDVSAVQVTVGAGDTFGGSSAERASFYVELVAKKARTGSTNDYLVRLERELQGVLSRVPEAELSLTNVSSSLVGGSVYTLNLASNDRELLHTRSRAALDVLAATPSLRNVTSSLSATAGERVFVVNSAGLDGTGLTHNEIFSTLSAYNVGSEVGKLRRGDEELPIRVKLDPLFLKDEESLLSLPVQAPALGSALPLGELGHFEMRGAPASVNRLNQSHSVTLTAQLTPGSSLSEVTRSVEAQLYAQGILDSRVSKQQGATLDLLGDLLFYGPVAFGLALLLNYLAIGSQFNSFKYPLYLLLTVPLALVGAVWLFLFTGTSLDVISVLGMVMLVGLVTKNAILLLDAALVEVKAGRGLKAALLEAAAVRFRPILMTTSTVVVISLPLLLGLGEGSEFRYPLGLVIVGGVLSSAFLTFYVVPAVFYAFERKAYGEVATKKVRRSREVRALPPEASV